MNAEVISELVEECSSKKEIEELVLWAYEQGIYDGIAEYREELDPTEEQEFRRTR